MIVLVLIITGIRSYREGQSDRIMLAIPAIIVVLAIQFAWHYAPMNKTFLCFASFIGGSAAVMAILPAMFASLETVRKQLGEVRFVER